jgi:hypothetical protein
MRAAMTVTRDLAFLSLIVLAACSSTSTVTPAADAGGAGPGEDAGETSPPQTSCTVAREDLLVPIDRVSTGDVIVISDDRAEKRIYVDASAGGPSGASRNPRVYLNLEQGAKVEITDRAAFESTAWDLALKRTVLYTNGGDAGPGRGEGAVIRSPFESVTAADADAAVFLPESFFDEECNAKTDLIGGPETTFSDWYEYEEATNMPTPRNITYLVKGATGTRYKIGIETFTANPDGTTDRGSTGYFLLRVAAL